MVTFEMPYNKVGTVLNIATIWWWWNLQESSEGVENDDHTEYSTSIRVIDVAALLLILCQENFSNICVLSR